MGVQWYFSHDKIGKAWWGQGVGTPTNSSEKIGAIGGQISLSSLSAGFLIEALSKVTQIKVVSSPYLTVLDGKPARLVVGDQIAFNAGSQTTSSGGGTTISQKVEMRETGVILEVQPRINADNSVMLSINQSITTPKGQLAEQGAQQPTLSTRGMKSDIIVPSGRTVLLGGLIQDREDKVSQGVPLLSKIPIIGNAFKNQGNSIRRIELIVMITPRVVRQFSELENITQFLHSKISNGEEKAVSTPPSSPISSTNTR